jgi:hypothetical protein
MIVFVLFLILGIVIWCGWCPPLSRCLARVLPGTFSDARRGRRRSSRAPRRSSAAGQGLSPRLAERTIAECAAAVAQAWLAAGDVLPFLGLPCSSALACVSSAAQR